MPKDTGRGADAAEAKDGEFPILLSAGAANTAADQRACSAVQIRRNRPIASLPSMKILVPIA